MLLKLSKLGVMEKAEASSYTYVLVGGGAKFYICAFKPDCGISNQSYIDMNVFLSI